MNYLSQNTLDNVKVFIYALVNPKNNKVFYVGATKNIDQRYSAHCSNPKTDTGIRIKNQSLKPILKVLETCELQNASERERYWISFYKQKHKTIQNGAKGGYPKEAGRKKLDPLHKKKQIALFPTLYQVKVMGGEEELKRWLHSQIVIRVQEIENKAG